MALYWRDKVQVDPKTSIAVGPGEDMGSQWDNGEERRALAPLPLLLLVICLVHGQRVSLLHTVGAIPLFG